MKIFGALLFAVFVSWEWKLCGSVETKNLTLCISQKSCENCLQASSFCAWCSDWYYSNSFIGRTRCNIPERLKEFGCPEEEIHANPEKSIEFLQDEDFQDAEETKIPIQLKPQRVKLRIPFHSKMEIPIRYRVGKNYPLDLYYLMDLTWSMKDDKETMISLGWNMSKTIGDFTNKFRLGFGSYADKPVMPFVFPGHESNPCKGEGATCAPIYSYWHRLELTDNIDKFVAKMNESLVTGNADNLEGGLDGIVQAIVCIKEIGWMRNARKIILVATDGYLHFAGDGKLGGAVRRQDFKCHLDELGQYSLSKEFDYASLAEVSKLLQEHKINLIFAVGKSARKQYEQMAKLLKEKARVATLSSDSSNILEIVESSYRQITSKVILRDNSSNWLRMEYFSNCGNETAPEWNTSECDNIIEGRVYDFKVVLSIDKCPRDEKLWKQTVVIEDALASEVSKTVIDVELLCGCNCMDWKSSHCEHGTNECGLCKCDFGWSGEKCDCNESLTSNNAQQCYEPKTEKICSDKGECICGECFCDEGYKGKFCECSACDKIGGIECSNRGTCQCGVCECIEGWQGNACQCPSTDNPCMAPGSQQVCAGHGYCDCGECRCNVTAADGSYYRGTYCESSISAGGSGLCILYNACVNATIEQPEKIDEFCRTNVTTYETEKVESVDKGNEHYCFVKTIKEKTTCVINYVYDFQKNNVVVLKIQDKVCHHPMHVAVIPSIIFIGTVFIGLLGLLCWKVWTHVQDKREYERFEQQRKKTVYSSNINPLYKPATTTFIVPPQFKED